MPKHARLVVCVRDEAREVFLRTCRRECFSFKQSCSGAGEPAHERREKAAPDVLA